MLGATVRQWRIRSSPRGALWQRKLPQIRCSFHVPARKSTNTSDSRRHDDIDTNTQNTVENNTTHNHMEKEQMQEHNQNKNTQQHFAKHIIHTACASPDPNQRGLSAEHVRRECCTATDVMCCRALLRCKDCVVQPLCSSIFGVSAESVWRSCKVTGCQTLLQRRSLQEVSQSSAWCYDCVTRSSDGAPSFPSAPKLCNLPNLCPAHVSDSVMDFQLESSTRFGCGQFGTVA